MELLRKNSYYQYFLEDISSRPIEGIKDENYILQNFRPSECAFSNSVIYLLDFTQKKYVYVDKWIFNVLGYSASEFLEKGLDDLLKKIHPADFEVINTKVFPDNFQFLGTLALTDYNNYIFSYNYRVRNAVGSYSTILDRFTFIPSELVGKPLGVIGVVFDITYFKQGLKMVHTVEEVISTANGPVNRLVFKHDHPIYDIKEFGSLSKKELEILKQMSKGYSSKQIADITGLSINTINNHRKNMLYKTNCKNSAELIKHASSGGIF